MRPAGIFAVIAILICGCASCAYHGSGEPNSPQAHLERMKPLLAVPTASGQAARDVHYFTVGHLAVAAATSGKDASRIRRYLETLLEEMPPYFKGSNDIGEVVHARVRFNALQLVQDSGRRV